MFKSIFQRNFAKLSYENFNSKTFFCTCDAGDGMTGNILLLDRAVAAGQQVPLWRDRFGASSSRSFNKPINDQSVRESMLDDLARHISELGFPYFIPQDDKLLALPVVID